MPLPLPGGRSDSIRVVAAPRNTAKYSSSPVGDFQGSLPRLAAGAASTRGSTTAEGRWGGAAGLGPGYWDRLSYPARAGWLALALLGCGAAPEPPECQGIGTVVDEPITADLVCPGGPDCPDEGDDILYAGAGRASITPEITERMTVDVDGDFVFDPDEDEYDDANGNGSFDAVWMAGLSSPRPADSVGDDLYVSAIALRQNETTIVMVSLDLIGYFHDEIDRVRAALPEELGVDYLVVAATHCHQCPDNIGLWGLDERTSGVNPAYNDMVRERIVQAVTQATGTLEPAHVTYGQIRTNDFPDRGTANYVSDVRDPVVIDDTLRVLRFERAEGGATIGTLVNWAAHPEYSGDRHQIVHPDYPGWLRRGVEDGIDLGSVHREGLGGICVFMNGALGGQIGPGAVETVIGLDGEPHAEDTEGSAEATGWSIAEYVFRALDAGETEETADLSFRSMRFTIPVRNYAYHVGLLIGVLDREVYDFDFDSNITEDNLPAILSEQAVLRIGRAQAVTLPGELFPELLLGGYDASFTPPVWDLLENADNEDPPDVDSAPCGPYLLDRMDGDYKLVLGLSQDFLGYIVPEYDFKLDPRQPYFEQAPGDHYEETNSVGPHMAQIVVGNLQTLLKLQAGGDR